MFPKWFGTFKYWRVSASTKWLKDRKERKLEFEDILHYQKIIVALSETDRIMNEINKIDISVRDGIILNIMFA
ncbi:MAG: hypothetical protein QM536_08885 [Chitinophagaceae bacterium]|nr:hypothetical protein [Chitinophagaceae bacterium]